MDIADVWWGKKMLPTGFCVRGLLLWGKRGESRESTAAARLWNHEGRGRQKNLDLHGSHSVREGRLNCIWHAENWGMIRIILNSQRMHSEPWFTLRRVLEGICRDIALGGSLFASFLRSNLFVCLFLAWCHQMELSAPWHPPPRPKTGPPTPTHKISSCFWRNVNIAERGDVGERINGSDELAPQSRRDTISPFLATSRATWSRRTVGD